MIDDIMEERSAITARAKSCIAVEALRPERSSASNQHFVAARPYAITAKHVGRIARSPQAVFLIG